MVKNTKKAKKTKKAKGKCSTKSNTHQSAIVEEVSEEIPVPEPTVHSLPVSERSGCEGTSASSQERQPMQPLEMYFNNSQFTQICKIQTKCYVTETVDVIKKLKPEVNWFTEHPQFHHFFHMPEEPNLKLMGMWMLLLRTIRIEEENIAWFGVNGVPIRYSMREHALISGLDCHEYPKRHLKLGSYKFVDSHFEDREKITIKDVKQKLLAMKSCSDRLKMAVLYFLGRIIRGKPKDTGPLDQFILRIVDRLDVCETFPWGRLTFEDAIKGIKHTMDLLKGEPHPTVGFAGFIIPLELLAFECIPSLAKEFRVSVVGCLKECPRMCKSRFTKTSMKGYPLEDIYAALGNTTVIDSILLPTVNEEIMLARIIDVEEEYEREGGQSDTWNYWLNVKGKAIWWEEMYELDMAARKFSKKKNKNKGKEAEASSSNTDMESTLKGLEERLMKSMADGFADLNAKVDTKFEIMEVKVTEIKKNQRFLKRKAKKMGSRLTSLESHGNEDMDYGEYMDFEARETMNKEKEDVEKLREEVEKKNGKEVETSEKEKENSEDDEVEISEKEKENIEDDKGIEENEKEAEGKDDQEEDEEKNDQEKTEEKQVQEEVRGYQTEGTPTPLRGRTKAMAARRPPPGMPVYKTLWRRVDHPVETVEKVAEKMVEKETAKVVEEEAEKVVEEENEKSEESDENSAEEDAEEMVEEETTKVVEEEAEKVVEEEDDKCDENSVEEDAEEMVEEETTKVVEEEAEKVVEEEDEKCDENSVEEDAEEMVEEETTKVVEEEAEKVVEEDEKCDENSVEKDAEEIVEEETTKVLEEEAEKMVEEAENLTEKETKKYSEEEKESWVMVVYNGNEKETENPTEEISEKYTEETMPMIHSKPKTRRAMAKEKAQIAAAAKKAVTAAKKTAAAAKKRSRPEKESATLVACTPRERRKPKWLQSPFTEGKTEDIEGPTKKRKTK